MTTTWGQLADADKAAIRASYPDRTNHELAEAYGITTSSLVNAARHFPAGRRRKSAETRARTYAARDAAAARIRPPPPPRDEGREHRLTQEVRALRKAQKRHLDETSWADTVVAALTPLVPAIPTQPMRASTVAGETSEEEMVLLLSDVHGGSYIRASETGGLSSYDSGTFHQRATRLHERLVSIKDKYGSHVRRLNIFCLGDLIEGQEIFKGQHHEIDQHVALQVVHVPAVLARMVAGWLPYFESIHIYPVRGNHGRMTFGRSAAPPTMSFDWICEQFMATLLRDQERIVWHPTDAWWQLVERQGHRFLLMHGDNIRGWAGIPLYGTIRKHTQMFQMVQARLPADLSGVAFDTMCIGHFHTRAWLEMASGDILVNGAWPGGSMYSQRELAANSVPSQKLFCVHRAHGITGLWPLYLDDRASVPRVRVDAA